MGLRAEHRELTRRKVLGAVLDLVADGSLDGLSVPAVARRSGVSVATIYRYFPSKDELLAAAAAEPSRRALAAPQRPATPDDDDEFSALLRAMWSEFADNLPLLRHQISSAAGREMRRARLADGRRRLADYLVGCGVDPSSPEGERLISLIMLVSSSVALVELHDRQGLDVDDAIESSAWAVRALIDATRAFDIGTRGGQNMTTPTPAPTFDPPGPGGWMALADHFPGALTPEYQRLYAETCPPGMGCYMARYGVLARTLDVAFVHGHLYITPVPLAGPREMRRPPPTAAVWVMARVHPEFRRRTRAARWALAERPWRAAATTWFGSERATWIDRARRVQDIDPAALSDKEVVEHLRSCRRLVVDGYRRHFELHGDDLLPIGLLIARCAEWGIEPDVAMRALDDAPSPVPAETAAWQLVTGYDLDSLSWHELGTTSTYVPPDGNEGVDLRPLVAGEHHAELDRLVADARIAVPLRDDNGGITGAWPMGLLRRAMLDAGRRIGLESPGLAVEMTVDELVARLGGASEPANGEVVERRADRARRSRLDAPASLGPDFAIPPLGALPRPLALIGAAQLATADHMLGGGESVGIGSTAYTGRAVVVDDPINVLDVIEPGDVVITRFTSPSWNSLLALAGAVVTTTGGLVSHAAVIARELGIPAVVGDTSAFERFRTGDIVTVDPAAATVRVERVERVSSIG